MIRVKYNQELLDSIIKRDGADLNYIYDNLTKRTKIQFTCKCGKKGEKLFSTLNLNAGAFCINCAKVLQMNKIKNTNLEKYGVEMPTQNKDILQKQKNTFLEKYGVTNPFRSNEIKDKIIKRYIKNYDVSHPSKSINIIEKTKKTNIKRYGSENPLQNKVIRDKCKKTNLQKYGLENPSQSNLIKNKVIETCIKKYGTSHPMKNIKIQQKQKATNLKRYGVNYVQHSLEIQEKIQKNAKKFKEYKMPSGEIRKVQGYEPFALDELVKLYTEQQIKTNRKDVPRIEYVLENKKHYYFPDIYITHENKIIEVKSTYTYNIGGYVLEKKEATKNKGYNYEIWVYDRKKNKEIK
jgi:hypothetical protein